MSDPFGIKSSKKAAEAQQEANDLTIRQNELASAKRRRESVREARVAIANSTQAAASQNVTTSSAAQGGVGGLRSQFTSNLSFLDNQNLIVDQTSAAIGRQRHYQAKAARAKAFTNLAIGGGLFAARTLAGG